MDKQRGTFHKCFGLETLGKKNDEAAKDMLARAATLVQPIMEKRQWTVHKLVEFFPANPNLLGLNYNQGEKVCVRLRPARNENSFLPFESVVGTLLHELTHIVHGPHQKPFYTLLAEITEECERLHVTAASFAGAGNVLPGRPVDRTAFGTAAAKAAEQRARSLAPQRLGGKAVVGQTPAEAAARAALQRKLDAVQCGTVGAEAEAPSLAPVGIASRSSGRMMAASSPVILASALPPEVAGSGVLEQSGKRVAQNWTCQTCTFVNEKPLAVICILCGQTRNRFESPDGDADVMIDEQPPRGQFCDAWACLACTYINEKPLALACGICAAVRPVLAPSCEHETFRVFK